MADIAVPIVAAAVPTAVFQLPNLVVDPLIKLLLVVLGLLVLAAVVVFQVGRGRRAASDADALSIAVERVTRQHEAAVQDAFGQIATRLARLADMPVDERRADLGAFADRIAMGLAFFLLPTVPEVRANVYALSADLCRLEPIGHAGAGDTAGDFVAGTRVGDESIDWVLVGGPPRVVEDVRFDLDDDAQSADASDELRYLSYASVVIGQGGRSFGMLTVDSPQPGVFTESVVDNIAVLASFMAAAFSLAHPLPKRNIPLERTR